MGTREDNTALALQNFSRNRSTPFYVQAYNNMPAYSGPESLNPEFRANFNPVSGGSVWERNMLQKQGLESRGAMDKMNASNSSNWATARSGLAMRGGIDAGARERMATSAAKTGIMGAQEQSRLDQMARLGIGAQGEDKRIDLEKYNNQGALDTSKWNISNSINQGLGRNAYNANRYESLMAGYGAEQTAKAAERPSGSWLCTEASGELNGEEWKLLAKLRRYSARRDRAATKFYIYGCKPLVDRMKAMSADWNENKKFVKSVVELVGSGKLSEAHDLYFNHTKQLIERYWPDCSDPVFQGGI